MLIEGDILPTCWRPAVAAALCSRQMHADPSKKGVLWPQRKWDRTKIANVPTNTHLQNVNFPDVV